MNLFLAVAVALGPGFACSNPEDDSQARPPTDEASLRCWLITMAYHRYSAEEMAAVVGRTPEAVVEALRRFDIRPETLPRRSAKAPLRVLPYPGGRHPRIGFLDGAVNPQRDTKVSVFPPWDESSYVVADLPEAIWSDLGLTYLAHTHIPTLWTKAGIPLPPKEWIIQPDGSLVMSRTLPNGIAFGTRVTPGRDAVRIEQWLTNGTDRLLSDLRVQNCVMLKAAAGFTAQTNANKVFRPPYAAVRSEDGRRWVITAWWPIHRTWGNPPCPCLHADPEFPDCPPGQTVRLTGWLSFYEGEDLDAELRRIDTLGSREPVITDNGSSDCAGF